MANAIRGNKIYIDSTGAVSTQRVKVAYVLFCPNNNGDEVALRETSSDVNIFHLHGETAKKPVFLDFSANPMVFNNGLYVQTLSSGAVCVIITTNRGGD